MRFPKEAAVLPGAMLLIFVAGCDTTPDIRYDKLNLVEVSGTVTLDGDPLANAVVAFEDEIGKFSYGLTDADGYYTLQFNSRVDGVGPGKKTVRISTARKITGLNTVDGGEAPPGEGGGEPGIEGSASQIELVPARYNKESELNRTVKPGEDQTFDFDLESEE